MISGHVIKRTLVVSSGVALAVVAIRRSRDSSNSDHSSQPTEKSSKSQIPSTRTDSWRIILRLLSISRDKQVIQIIASMIGCALIFAVVDVKKAFVSGQLFRSVYEGDRSKFKLLLTTNVGLSLILTIFNKVLANLVSSLGRHLHLKLVGKLHDLYFNRNNYYRIQNVIDLPHERIATDAPQLTRDLALMSCDIVNSLINFMVFSRQVYKFGKRIAGDRTWNGARLIVGPVGYAMLGSIIVSRVVPNLGFIKKTQRELESKYKQTHVRLCRNAEAVALYGGEEYEEAVIKKHFKNLTEFNEGVRWSGLPSELIKEYITRYCLHTAMMLLVLTPFFSESDPSRGSNSGQAMYRIRVLSELITMELIALSQIARMTNTVQRVSGLVDRVGQLVSELANIENKSTQIDNRGTTTDNSIVFDDVSISTPTGHKLVTGLSFIIKPGENFLLCGPNGAGKSSIFRCLGGLWPIDGGKILRPAGDTTGLHSLAFYLPQKPYTVHGTLLQNITYPNMEQHIDDKQLQALFRLVELEYLYLQTKALDALHEVINWETRLSLGEQQRLAMARLFWHRPTYAVLDECTSAVSLKMERRLFRLCRELGITLITISHRPALQDFHDRMLVLDGAGGYQIHKLSMKSETQLTHSVSHRSLTDLHTMLDNYPFDKIVARLERSGSIALFHDRALTSAGDAPLLKPVVGTGQFCQSLDTRRLWKASMLLMRTCWNKDDVWRAFLILGIVVVRTYISNSLAGISGDSIRYLIKGRHKQFVQVVILALIMGFLQALFMPMLDVMEGDLADAWRKRITNMILTRYMRHKKYFEVATNSSIHEKGTGKKEYDIALPDQVIVDDVENLTKSIASLWSECAKPSVDFVWFSSSVFSLTGWRGLGYLAVYMVAGTGVLNYIRPNLGELAATKEQLDGEFLQVHARVSQCSESISFLEGGKAERIIVDRYLRAKIHHQFKQKRIEHIYGVADQFVTYFLPQSASWVLSMMYKSSKGEQSGDVLIRDLRYLGSVVNQCFSSLGLIVQLGAVWASTKGHLDRVATLVDRLELENGTRECVSLSAVDSVFEPFKRIELHNVDVVPPTGDKVLVHKLTLTLDGDADRGLMVTGPSGSGKSTLLKCMDQLIKPTTGSVRSNPSLIHYIPTKPYLTEGCLADQITYPHVANQLMNELEILEALKVTRIAYLNDRDGGIFGTTSDSWDTRLSLGEQQRIAVARLLFQKKICDYQFVFLDECTSAVALDGEEEMYKAISARGLCCVTASQKPWLLQFHDRILQLSEDSTYEISDVPVEEDSMDDHARLPEVVYMDARQTENHVTFVGDVSSNEPECNHDVQDSSSTGTTRLAGPSKRKQRGKQSR